MCHYAASSNASLGVEDGRLLQALPSQLHTHHFPASHEDLPVSQAAEAADTPSRQPYWFNSSPRTTQEPVADRESPQRSPDAAGRAKQTAAGQTLVDPQPSARSPDFAPRDSTRGQSPHPALDAADAAATLDYSGYPPQADPSARDPKQPSEMAGVSDAEVQRAPEASSPAEDKENIVFQTPGPVKAMLETPHGSKGKRASEGDKTGCGA